MGVRINKIEIRGFRGIPFLELILDGKNLVIRGDNGTGKSSIVEAIEFFFTKRVAHLEKSKSLSTKRYAPHINFKPKDVKITITFNPGNIVLSKTFSSDPNPPGSLKEYFNEAQKGTFILRRSQIIEFIVSPPSERFRAIGSIIGIEPLDEIELQMMKVRDELEGVINSKKEEKKRILGELSKTLEKKIESIEDVLLILNKRLKNAKLPPILSLENTDKYYENLLRKMKETRDIDRISNLNEIAVLIKTPLTYEGIFDEITNFSEKVKKLLRKEAKIELSVANLLRDGKKILEEEELDKCPLCGQNINRDKLLEEINHRLETLQALTKEASEVRRQSSGIINRLNSILEKLKRVTEKLKVFPEFVDEQGNLAQRISFIEKLIEAVSNAKDLKEEIFIPVKEFAQEKSEIEKLWTSISKKCNKLLRKEKLTKKEKYMLEIISLIEGIKNKIGEVRRISSELEGYKKQYELAKKIYATFSEVKKKKIQEVYSTIQADICKFYESLHPNEPHRSIKITINPKRRASTELWIESFGREADPRAYASEGHLDSLGLCIFLAFVKKFNKKCSLVILDDVVTTIDSGHRERICELLLKEFKDKQLIITTHDAVWFEQLRSAQRALRVDGNFKNLVINRWELETGPIIEQYKPIWERIQEKIRDGDKSAAQDGRIYLEWILKRICELMSVLVPFKASSMYTVGDLFPPAKKRLKELIKDPKFAKKVEDAFQSLEKTVIMGNILSHDNVLAKQVSIKEVKSFCNAVHNLHCTFSCPNCGHFLKYFSELKIIRCQNPKCEKPLEVKAK